MELSRSHKKYQTLNSSPDPNSWQIIYTGFVLIMLCFFILLTSFASLQQSKITRFSRAFSTAVSVFSDGKSIETGQTVTNGQFSVLEKENKLTRLFEQVQNLSERNNLVDVQVRLTPRGVVMTLPEKLLFQSGEDRFTDEAFPVLEAVGRVLGKVQVPVQIEGHTDNKPIHTVRFASNWELSTARAVNVLRHLTDQGKVDSNRISAVGFSEFQPIAPNDTPENMARNRRVEIVFQID